MAEAALQMGKPNQVKENIPVSPLAISQEDAGVADGFKVNLKTTLAPCMQAIFDPVLFRALKRYPPLCIVYGRAHKLTGPREWIKS